MKRAFLAVQAAACSEIATSTRRVVTEEYMRAALLRGLMLAYPSLAHRVDREISVSWDATPCVGDHPIPPRHRPLQHDIRIGRSQGDAGLACEVKWLVATGTDMILRDVWKLVLSRGAAPENSSLRTYLLVGGESSAFSATLRGARRAGIDLRWSAAGAGQNRWPSPRVVSVRTPPPCGYLARISLRDRWYVAIPPLGPSSAVKWRICLWELDRREVGDDTVDWTTSLASVVCAATAAATGQRGEDRNGPL